MNTSFRFKGVALVAIWGLWSAVSAFADWEKGDELPDLSEFGLKGDVPSIEGKVTYVDFWASWCGPCKASFPALDELYRKHGPEGFQIVAVSVDAREKAMKQFLDRVKPSFLTVWDQDQKLVAESGIEVMPSSFLVDAKGVIRFTHRGWGGDASAKELEEEVQALLKEASE